MVMLVQQATVRFSRAKRPWKNVRIAVSADPDSWA